MSEPKRKKIAENTWKHKGERTKTFFFKNPNCRLLVQCVVQFKSKFPENGNNLTCVCKLPNYRCIQISIQRTMKVRRNSSVFIASTGPRSSFSYMYIFGCRDPMHSNLQILNYTVNSLMNSHFRAHRTINLIMWRLIIQKDEAS